MRVSFPYGETGRDSNVQGSASDIKAKDSARYTWGAGRMRISNMKIVNINIGVRSVSALMP